MKFASVTGYIATCLSIIAFLPVVYDVYKHNNKKGLVIQSLILFFMSQVMWFLHGNIISDIPVLISTSVNMILYSYLIYRFFN